MCKTCGIKVNSLLIGGGLIYTGLRNITTQHLEAMENCRVISFLSKIGSQTYTQLKQSFSPLFEQVFYPVSTEPIIMNTR